MENGKSIQNAIQARLGRHLPPSDTYSEWRALSGASDVFAELKSYAPRPDIAVGPFNKTAKGRRADAEKIRGISWPIIRRLERAIAAQNGSDVDINLNPRCLLAIEVEHATSSKHVLGAFTNVSMLGRFGIVVASERLLPKALRIFEYVRGLKHVEKAPHSMFANVGCFSAGEFLDLLETN